MQRAQHNDRTSHRRRPRAALWALLVMGCMLLAAPGAARPMRPPDAPASSASAEISKLLTNAISLSLGGMLFGDRERFLDKATRTMPLVADAPARIAGASAALSAFFSSLFEHE